MKKLTGLVLLLGLAACDINQPQAPRLKGQWQCSNGIAITFVDMANYTVSTPAGESAGVYKLIPGENNFHRIDWNGDAKDAEAPLPPRFRYFEISKGKPFLRLTFYTHVVDDAIACERRP